MGTEVNAVCSNCHTPIEPQSDAILCACAVWVYFTNSEGARVLGGFQLVDTGEGIPDKSVLYPVEPQERMI